MFRMFVVQKLGSDIDKHKNELEELKKQDPEFFNFLKQNDRDLLKFGEEEDDEEDDEGAEGDDGEGEDDEEGGEDEDDEDEDEDAGEQKERAEKGKKARELTKEYITSLANSAERVTSLPVCCISCFFFI